MIGLREPQLELFKTLLNDSINFLELLINLYHSNPLMNRVTRSIILIVYSVYSKIMFSSAQKLSMSKKKEML